MSEAVLFIFWLLSAVVLSVFGSILLGILFVCGVEFFQG